MANVVIPYVSPLLPGEAFACDALHPGLVLCSQNHHNSILGLYGNDGKENGNYNSILFCDILQCIFLMLTALMSMQLTDGYGTTEA